MATAQAGWSGQSGPHRQAAGSRVPLGRADDAELDGGGGALWRRAWLWRRGAGAVYAQPSSSGAESVLGRGPELLRIGRPETG